MPNFDELEEEFLSGEDADVPPSGPMSVDPEERRKRREVMERRSGQELQKKWQQEDRRALEEAEALAAPPIRSSAQCHTCQSPHRLWIERKLVQGHAYKTIADQIPDGPSRRSIANHFRQCMQIDQQAMRALLEEEAAAIGQNIEEGVRGAFTLRGSLELLIRKAFHDAQDGVTTVEPRDMIQMIKALNDLNANVGTAAVEEAKIAIAIFKEALQNVLLKGEGDVVERDLGVQILTAISAEVERLRSEQEADMVMDRTLALPSGI